MAIDIYGNLKVAAIRDFMIDYVGVWTVCSASPFHILSSVLRPIFC